MAQLKDTIVTGDLSVTGTIFGNGFVGDLTGNADTATKLGTANVGGITSPIYLAEGVPTAVQQTSTTRRFSVIPAINSSGVMEIGKYIDFHALNADASDYTVRLTADTNILQVSSVDTASKTLRNISYGTTTPTGGANGDVYIQYNSTTKPEVFPVDAIYLSVSSTNPGTYFAGTWTQIAQGRALFGAGTLNGNTYTAGNTIDAGLPNVSGKVGRALSEYNLNNADYGNHVTDPFYYNETESMGTTGNVSSGSNDAIRLTYMDLSRANTIYGNSTTVQPNAFVVYVWRRTA